MLPLHDAYCSSEMSSQIAIAYLIVKIAVNDILLFYTNKV